MLLTLYQLIQIYASTTNHCAATLAPALAVRCVLDARGDASEAGGKTSKAAEPLMGIVGSGPGEERRWGREGGKEEGTGVGGTEEGWRKLGALGDR